jgi:hypothetical protein
VESDHLSDFAQVMETDRLLGSESRQLGRCRSPRLNLEGNQTKNGLGQLVLTLVKVLHELLERQAIRWVEAGSLSREQVERLGLLRGHAAAAREMSRDGPCPEIDSVPARERVDHSTRFSH